MQTAEIRGESYPLRRHAEPATSTAAQKSPMGLDAGFKALAVRIPRVGGGALTGAGRARYQMSDRTGRGAAAGARRNRG
jgi:hypothetical protein